MRPRLKPLPVPWQVDPGAPFLRLTAAEQGSAEPTQVSFVAYFLNEESSPGGADGTSAQIASPPERLGAPRGPLQLVVASFEAAVWARFNPSFSDTAEINFDEFDRSEMRLPYEPGTDAVAWVQRFRSLWHESGLCPDPRIYEIQYSQWLRDLHVQDPTFKHYLVLGHDATVDIAARDWSWESKGEVIA